MAEKSVKETATKKKTPTKTSKKITEEVMAAEPTSTVTEEIKDEKPKTRTARKTKAAAKAAEVKAEEPKTEKPKRKTTRKTKAATKAAEAKATEAKTEEPKPEKLKEEVSAEPKTEKPKRKITRKAKAAAKTAEVKTEEPKTEKLKEEVSAEPKTEKPKRKTTRKTKAATKTAEVKTEEPKTEKPAEEPKQEEVTAEVETQTAESMPEVIEEPKQEMYVSPRKSVAFIGSECYPFVKTGGLGDVMYALPKALVKQNCDVKVILPRYACIPWKYQEKMVYRGSFQMDLCADGRSFYVGIMEYVWDGVVYDFIDNEEFFSAGDPYISLIDDIPKYCYFAKAALAALNYMDWVPDIIHCHDWQAALVPVYLRTMFESSKISSAKTILTIHNLRFQGI